MVKKRAKEKDHTILLAHCILARVLPAKGKRHVTIEVTTSKPGRRNDSSNLLKSTFDGLVKAGALVDDSERWLSYDKPVVQHGPQTRTVIKITEVS
jgi:Holliday junction resolvase RusA-like endonuclease